MNFFINPLRNKYFPLIVLILFLLVIRLLILFSGVDGLVYDEETDIGTIAKVLIGGISPAFIFQHTQNYRWGAVILGIFTVPFFLLFGDSLVVLRLVAMFFSLGMLITMYLFLYNFFDRKVAILTSLFFIFSPPNYTKMSFVCWGGYTEINFISILTILLFYKIFFTGTTKGIPSQNSNLSDSGRYLFVLFGVMCGFGLFYDYLFLLTLSCCLLFWYSFDKYFILKKNFHIFALSFLISFSPWFYYNATHNWNAIFVMRGASLLSWYAKNDFLESLIQLRDLITFIVPGYFSFKGLLFINKTLISYAYYFILAVSFVGLFWLQRKSIVKFILGLMPPRRFNTSSLIISRETFLIIHMIIFGLAYTFCGIPYIPKVEADLVIPYRFVVFLLPFLFMVTAIFLVKISNNKYGARVSKILITVLIAVGLISNVSMISVPNYMISILPQGYNLVVAGQGLRQIFGDDIAKSLQYFKKVNDKKYLRFIYDGYEWAIPQGSGSFSIIDYVQKKMKDIPDKEFWPLAYENLGMAMWRNPKYSKNMDEDLKRHVDQVYYPYFYRGLGRSFANKGIDVVEYNYILTIIDKQYWPYFHEGLGIEMDVIFVDNHQKFSQFMSTIDTERKTDIYRGFAKGREYRKISYRKFNSGFGKIDHSIETYKNINEDIAEEFKPYYYQRLGVEIGWRFIHDIKGYCKFLEKVDKKYRPYIYKGLGIGIGWRFGFNINGCVELIKQTESRFWTNIYEGLGIGAVRRYGYQSDETLKNIEIEKIPAAYRNQFCNGLREAGGLNFDRT